MDSTSNYSNMLYILSPDIFFRKYDDSTIVYKTDNKKIFDFNGICFDILCCFKSSNSIKGCLEQLFNIYSDSSKEELYEGVVDFIYKLVDYGILNVYDDCIYDDNVSNYESSIISNCVNNNCLYEVLFELTYNCNENCKHCYRDDYFSSKELSLNEIKKVLDELKEMNVFEVTFTGGELFTRKDALEILKYAYDLHFLINIYTNGTLLNDDSIIFLKTIHPRSIHFSLYASNQKTHDEFTCLTGSFNKTLSAIQKCSSIGIPVNIKYNCMNFNNKKDIDEILELAKNLNSTVQFNLTINPTNSGEIYPLNYRISSVDGYYETYKHIYGHSNSSSNHKNNNSKEGNLCGAGINTLSINPYGDVFPCNAFLIKCGNIREKPLKEIWENSDNFKMIRNLHLSDVKGCEGCNYFNYCSFCPGNALNECKDYLKKYDDACNMAIAMSMLKERREK